MKAKTITLGRTGITTVQNAFGALPIQRADKDTAVKILRRAYEGGMTYFDTARAYSDSEEKLGIAFEGLRNHITLATKTQAKTPEKFWKDLETSLTLLKTDHIDVYQLHNVSQCYAPGDGTGMYECMEEAKKQGKILHISCTSHKLPVAMECVESGLYDTMQFPFSYLSSEKDLALVRLCQEKNVGFIAMKGLSGGLITKSRVAFAFMSQFEGVLPIWGIQKMSEVEEWISYMDDAPEMTEDIRSYIEKEKQELSGEFCRGCGYCMPCPAGIEINNCARMSLMLRRAPSASWLTKDWQEKMMKIEDYRGCRKCTRACPYELDTPALLKKNLEDYKKVLSGERTVHYQG
ncbi:MAG: aldo/keto reductase [Blautia sp.]|nr:aldo/keto reductase [Blautia sp.]